MQDNPWGQPPRPDSWEQAPDSGQQWTTPPRRTDQAQEPVTTESLQEQFPEPEASTHGFPREIKEAVNGLVYLGYLAETFEFCGHHFHIRTLRSDEELLAYRLAQTYQDSVGGWSKALACAHVALSLISIDRDEHWCPPLGPVNDKYEDYALPRWRYVTEKWYYPTADFIFRRYTDLMEQQAEAIEAMQDLSERSRMNYTPSADFSTEQGTSPEILDYLEPPDSQTPSS